MELEQIWEEALKMIEEETSPVSFATWIQPIVPCGIIGNKIILQVKESFLKEIIEKRPLPLTRNMYSIPLLSATATVWRMPHPLPLRNLRHRRIIPCFYTAIPGLAKRT